MENNNFENSSFEKLLIQKNQDGWDYVGMERLTKTNFNKDKGKFEDIVIQSEAQVIDMYSDNGKYEVDLILDLDSPKLKEFKNVMTPDEYDNLLKNLEPKYKHYFVFTRLKQIE